MKTVTFTWPHQTGGYGCNQPGDQSGEYVRVDDVKSLVSALREFVEWNAKYPSSRIYNEPQIRVIAKELDVINEKSVKAIGDFEKP